MPKTIFWLCIVAIWFCISFFYWLRARRRKLAEIQRFESLPRTTDDAFLKDIGIEADSPFAKQALAVRGAIAELATISTASLSASVRISSDLNQLPFFDSPDILGVILKIEEKTGMKIEDEFQEELCEVISKGSISDIVKAVVNELQRESVLPSGQDLERRQRVWKALSELFLDTELDERDYRWIAAELANSGFSYSEVRTILWDEIYPALAINLRHPAGEWAGFPMDWMQARIFSRKKKETPADYPGCAQIAEKQWQKLLPFLPSSWVQE